ncbi:aminomethyl-transferring glycine dehydrogenase subunit GcvPB [Pseudogracilibacillus auburnensis]|uniref:aminomethyl-transferring glycine dehydrogenase subunit GcvPB n=1 Tax=Pseudogracilibacillus auburnensis TaxID=1494959 RepID=UPI001A9771CC|nr:aminomethyl-transferring glycine dehydrogenase subunit GcvPB [Pseudogracilibacillus auburnensis]MBO1005858.1 aminomethyl-transferring glycine dehydrogenase subunit GcvPB [Pseudogracilibacillus auburnensis]
MRTKNYPLIFERSKQGRKSYSLPPLDVPELKLDDEIEEDYIRKNKANLPEVSELELIRHYTGLSTRNFGIDSGFYPLGSCTMKYNPKLNEDIAKLDGFSYIHPYQDPQTVQGALEVMYDLGKHLREITGMEEVSLQPAAGAHGEWTALLMIRAFHEANGDMNRTKVLIPDSAHGTNPASATVAGFESVTIQTNEQGLVDLEDLKKAVGKDTAALMLTNPNTLGLFETEIMEMAEIVHDAGGKLYYDGANLNAIMGYVRPGDMGFDAVHLNLHKTFTGPHGGGGPGSGPIAVTGELAPFLPKPLIKKQGNTYVFDEELPQSIGRVKPYYGNFGINLRAYTYIRTMGATGLKKVSEYAVLNANYMMRKLSREYDLPFKQHCKHEFVLSGKKQKMLGVRTLDIAKRLLDYGFHPPTIYFPLNVEEALMIEPTETESKDTLDLFIDTMLQIAEETRLNPEIVQDAPHHTVVKRMDETTAARRPILKYDL